jgi:hypothetical protein
MIPRPAAVHGGGTVVNGCKIIFSYDVTNYGNKLLRIWYKTLLYK